MAIIVTLFGGIIGFVSFLTAMLVFDASFLAACGIYMAFGFGTTVCVITLTLIPTRADRPEAQTT